MASAQTKQKAEKEFVPLNEVPGLVWVILYQPALMNKECL